MFDSVQDFAIWITDPVFLASVLAAGASFLTIISLASPALAGGRLAGRMKAVARRREELRRRSRVGQGRDPDRKLKRSDGSAFRRFVDKLDLEKALEDPNLVDLLAQAGLRGPRPVATFYFARFTLPIVFFIAGLLYFFILAESEWSSTMKLAGAIAACVAGFYLPNIWLINMVQKRQQSIMRAFPDSLDLLLICVESGMSIELAFQRVSQEIGPVSMELAEEFSLTTAELAYLPDRRIAYENLGRRTNHQGVKAVCTALIQAERYGTPLGAALRVMAKENRDLRMTAAEKKAAALPPKLTVPMILFFLPVLFIVILTPAYIRWQNMQDGNPS
jgi:tight adherence protein C